MAKVWLARDGKDPTRGGPLAEVTLPTCEAKLGLRRSDFFSGLTQTPRFGDPEAPSSMVFGYRHVVVELGEPEAAGHGWRPGFYHVPCSPEEACIPIGGELLPSLWGGALWTRAREWVSSLRAGILASRSPPSMGGHA